MTHFTVSGTPKHGRTFSQKQAFNFWIQSANVLPMPSTVVRYACPQCGDRFEDRGTGVDDSRLFELVYDCLLCGHGLEFDFISVSPSGRVVGRLLERGVRV